jgi:hypothetical protein
MTPNNKKVRGFKKKLHNKEKIEGSRNNSEDGNFGGYF